MNRAITWLLLASILLWGSYLFAIQKYGVGLTPDSVTYLACADNIATGHGFISFDGSPLINWAPLFSIIISPAYYFNWNPFSYISILNICSLIASIFIVFYSIRRFQLIDDLKFWYLLLLVPAVLFKLCVTIYSEPIFILFQSIFWLHFIRYLKDYKYSSLLWAAFWMGLMCLQRYAGFILFGVAILMIPTQGFSKTHRIHLLSFLLIVLLLNLPWFIRNQWFHQAILGQHEITNKFSFKAFGMNLKQAILHMQYPVYRLFGIATSLFFWILSAVFVQKRTEGLRKLIARSLWFYCSAYFFLLFMQSHLHLFELARYISVIYLPMCLYVAILAEQWVKYYGFNKPNQRFLRICYVLFFLVNAFALIHESKYAHENGIGLNGETWHQLELPDSVVSLKPMCNYPDYLWLLTHQTQAFFKYKHEDFNSFIARSSQREYYLWINHPMRRTIADVNEMPNNYAMELIHQNRKWKLYRCKLLSQK